MKVNELSRLLCFPPCHPVTIFYLVKSDSLSDILG